MPLFELEEGPHRKFYRIERVGRHIELQWGRIGTQGQRKTLELASEAEARREYNAEIDRRKERGYSQVHDEEQPRSAAEAQQRDLERKTGPLTEHQRFVFTKGQRMAWIEVRHATLVVARDTDPPEEQALASEAAATRARDALMTKLVRQGYVLATFGAAEEKSKKQRAADKGRLFRHDQLELALAADPDDAGTWSVYEDWLLAQGDARSPIIEAERLGDVDEAEKARGRIAKLLFPKRGDTLMMMTRRGRWQAGFVRSCWVSATGKDGDQVLAALVASPAARFLTELEVHLDRFERLATTPPAHVRTLHLRTDTPAELDATSIAPFDDLLDLDVQTVTSVQQPEALERLRSLSLEYAADLALGDLLSDPLPRLERLSLRMTDRALFCRDDIATCVPALRDLELVLRPDLTTTAIDLVLASGLVPQLARLQITSRGRNRLLTADDRRAFRGGVLATIGDVVLADNIQF